jgi:hypothetical protein
MAVIGCLFSETSLYVWSATQLIGWVLPIFIMLFARSRDPRTGKWTAEAFLTLYGQYTWISLSMLYILQIALNQQQPDPFCPYLTTPGVPALAPFYIGSVIGLTLFLPIFLEFYYSWFTGITILFCIWIAPAAVLVWFSIFTAAQVGLSLGIGVLNTLIFMLIYKFWWMPHMPWLLNTWVFKFLCLSETWFSSAEQQQYTVYVAECVAQQERGRRSQCCC